jgi:hypothetical protein
VSGRRTAWDGGFGRDHARTGPQGRGRCPNGKDLTSLEEASRLAMTFAKMSLDLLEQAAPVECPMCGKGKLGSPAFDGGGAASVSSEGPKIGVHDPLGLVDGAGSIGDGQGDDLAHCLTQVVHSSK